MSGLLRVDGRSLVAVTHLAVLLGVKVAGEASHWISDSVTEERQTRYKRFLHTEDFVRDTEETDTKDFEIQKKQHSKMQKRSRLPVQQYRKPILLYRKLRYRILFLRKREGEVWNKNRVGKDCSGCC